MARSSSTLGLASAAAFLAAGAYIYRGEEGEVIPRDETHRLLIVHEDVTVILAKAFLRHYLIAEIICHEGVEQIEESAFRSCESLRRVIMPGVTIVRRDAFYR